MRAQYGQDDKGAVYVFEIFSGTLDISADYKSITGSGDDCIIMLYATAQETDGYPTAGEYSVVAVKDLTQESTNCVIGGSVNQQGQPIGTYAYVVEDGDAVDGILCTGGTIKFEGNATKGVMTANLEFVNSNGETVTREYIYAGETTLEYKPMGAPSKVQRVK